MEFVLKCHLIFLSFRDLNKFWHQVCVYSFAGPTGEYLELLTSEAAKDMISILYRKACARSLVMLCTRSLAIHCRSKRAAQSSSRTFTRWSTQLWSTSPRSLLHSIERHYSRWADTYSMCIKSMCMLPRI